MLYDFILDARRGPSAGVLPEDAVRPVGAPKPDPAPTAGHRSPSFVGSLGGLWAGRCCKFVPAVDV